MKLRGAVFGCGMISEFHLRGWLRIPEVEIVALGNRTVEKAEARRLQYAPQARVYASLEAMLAAGQLDFVDILTAPALHREQCLLAREAGVHIICQKPLCDSLEAARALAREMAGYPKLFAVHENHRYRPWFQVILDKLAGGFFGSVKLVKVEHLNATGPAESYKQEGETGVLLEYGSHLVDMMRCLLGEPTGVYARLHRLHPSIRGESLAHAVFEFAGATAVVEAAWKPAAMTQGGLLVAGTQGEAWYEGTLTRGQHGRFRLSRGGAVVHDAPRCPTDDYVESFYLLERECADVMLGRRPGVIQTAEEHLKTLEWTFAAYAAAGGR